MNLDVLVFAAHPDDAELSMGGTIAKFTESGFKVGIIDLTQGEMGTRGSVEIRKNEAADAAKILKISVRENLLIPDGDIRISNENINKVVVMMRKYCPGLVFAPYFNDRHPDHIHTSDLIKEAMFVSGLSKAKTFVGENAQAVFRPSKLFYYMQTYTFQPSFIVDITGSFEKKLNSIRAFKTQFHNPDSNEPETFISKPEFIDFVEARAKYFGFQIGKKFGEPFYSEVNIELSINDMLNN
ncbi:MAG: bacillithiol biosynthesis deacetylase BshB1 [Bacteroidetes bacterium]|nr:bacillithiol biosynthesis deacetylase BshB1 [Bacteroidota bacterium]MCH7772474.1 bacillithiol biosynthesis deacetylase BshB1 [Bacteroidota bacterium]